MVNGKKVNIPSYEVKLGETVSITTKAAEIPAIKKILASEDVKLPSWLERKAVVGKMKSLPKREDIMEPMSEQDVVEFYSRQVVIMMEEPIFEITQEEKDKLMTQGKNAVIDYFKNDRLL